MNQETDNEIDLMLRKLGRQSGSASTGVSNEIEDHLDADELNMYAENALSAVARARYTEHLADCTRCRQMVSQLTMAAGLVVPEKKTQALAPTGIKAFITSFFSPMVLRYAVPAMALVIVASIGFFVLRDSSSRQLSATRDAQTSIAKNEAPATKQPIDNSGFVDSTNRSSAAKPQTPEPKQAESPRSESSEAATAKESADRKPDEPAKQTDQVAAAPATAGAYATPIPKPAAADDQARAGQDVAEKKKQPAEEAAASEVAKTQAKAEEQRKVGATGLARAEPARNAPPKSTQQRARDNEADERGRRADKDDAETRSVAGRQFRREGSTWIDTAFSSQPTTVVTRGSEQYRALVADEPALKTIADQLAGEVIVVWKGRAYRIR